MPKVPTEYCPNCHGTNAFPEDLYNYCANCESTHTRTLVTHFESELNRLTKELDAAERELDKAIRLYPEFVENERRKVERLTQRVRSVMVELEKLKEAK